MTTCHSIDYIAVIDGCDSDGSMAAHISACVHCQKELAAYRKLITALVTTRQARGAGCLSQDTIVRAALGESEGDTGHLADCGPCRKLYDDIRSAVAGVDEAVTEGVALPPALAALAEKRKKKYQAARLRKVIDLQGIRDRNAQDETIAGMLSSEADDALPLAAFPDDLSGKEEEREKNRDQDDDQTKK